MSNVRDIEKIIDEAHKGHAILKLHKKQQMNFWKQLMKLTPPSNIDGHLTKIIKYPHDKKNI